MLVGHTAMHTCQTGPTDTSPLAPLPRIDITGPVSHQMGYVNTLADSIVSISHHTKGVFTGVFSCRRVASEDAGRAAYNQLHLHLTGEYERQQAGISC